jgi:hypothetical protein
LIYSEDAWPLLPYAKHPEVAAFLETITPPNIVTRFDADIRGYEESFPLWRLKI